MKNFIFLSLIILFLGKTQNIYADQNTFIVDNIIVKGKGDESLRFTTGFYRDLPGLTDFAKIETYRIKIRVGYAF